MNKTLMERVRSMLSGAGLEKKFWEKLVSTACYLINRSSTLILVDKNPMEVWKSKNPSLHNIHVFVCEAYAHVPKYK